MAPPRVVSLIASSTEMVCALDCGEWLVARSHECDHPAWVRKLPAVTAPAFATGVSSEAIDRSVRSLVERGLSVYRVDAGALAALKPDLIITQTQCQVCAVSLSDVEQAVREVAGSQARIVALEPNALEDILRDYRRVADALGVPERGVQQITRLNARMNGVAARASGLAPRPRIACIEWMDPLMAAGNWTPQLIERAGGIDLFGKAGVHALPLTWAELAAADPDMLWVTPCGFDLARIRAEMPALTSHSEWRMLRAVREGRVFLGDGNAFFNRPGPRVAETLEILAEALHPEAFRFGHEGTGWERLERPAH
jgi:iron complex transport system substrate-binding protein